MDKNGIQWFTTIARPLAPPIANFCGIKKKYNPIDTISIPIVINIYSFIFLLKSTPLIFDNKNPPALYSGGNIK